MSQYLFAVDGFDLNSPIGLLRYAANAMEQFAATPGCTPSRGHKVYFPLAVLDGNPVVHASLAGATLLTLAGWGACVDQLAWFKTRRDDASITAKLCHLAGVTQTWWEVTHQALDYAEAGMVPDMMGVLGVQWVIINQYLRYNRHSPVLPYQPKGVVSMLRAMADDLEAGGLNIINAFHPHPIGRIPVDADGKPDVPPPFVVDGHNLNSPSGALRYALSALHEYGGRNPKLRCKFDADYTVQFWEADNFQVRLSAGFGGAALLKLAGGAALLVETQHRRLVDLGELAVLRVLANRAGVNHHWMHRLTDALEAAYVGHVGVMFSHLGWSYEQGETLDRDAPPDYADDPDGCLDALEKLADDIDAAKPPGGWV